MSNSNREELQAFSKIVKATQGADFGPALQSSLSRRRFFIAGGATISFGALLAACGGTTDTGIARIGDSPEKTELVDAPVTDIALLRTATSLEHNAIFVYETVAAAGLLSGDAATLAARFLSDHKAHAEATASLTEKLGGKAYNEPNPRLQSIYIEPALRLITGDEPPGIPVTEDPVADVLALAYALETIAGSTYQVYVPMLADAHYGRLRSELANKKLVTPLSLVHSLTPHVWSQPLASQLLLSIKRKPMFRLPPTQFPARLAPRLQFQSYLAPPTSRESAPRST